MNSHFDYIVSINIETYVKLISYSYLKSP